MHIAAIGHALMMYQIGARRPGKHVQASYGQIDRALALVVLVRDDHSCVYCNQHTDRVCYIVPRSYGGPTIVDNTVSICKSCRSKKGYKLESEWTVKGFQYIVRHGGSISWVDEV